MKRWNAHITKICPTYSVHKSPLAQMKWGRTFFPPSGSQRWDTSVGTLRLFWLAARPTSGRTESARGSSWPWIRPPSLTHRYDPANLQLHATLPTCCVFNGFTFAGWGDSAADERRALPGVFGQVSGERGPNIQGGYQNIFGFYPQTEETQEEVCHLVTPAVGLRTRGEWTDWLRVKSLVHQIMEYINQNTVVKRSTFRVAFKRFYIFSFLKCYTTIK